MSPFFIQTLKKELKCPSCNNLKVTGKSFCSEHLRYAREHWRTWSSRRKADGLCSWCTCKSFRGWLRCRKHAELNRQKCLDWYYKHADEKYEAVKQQKIFYKNQGLCWKCVEHKKLDGDFVDCYDCRKRRSDLRAGRILPFFGTRLKNRFVKVNNKLVKVT